MKLAVESLAVLTGVPYTGPKRVVEAIKEQKPSVLLGGKTKKKKKGIESYP
jgi:hypothetical protein